MAFIANKVEMTFSQLYGWTVGDVCFVTPSGTEQTADSVSSLDKSRLRSGTVRALRLKSGRDFFEAEIELDMDCSLRNNDDLCLLPASGLVVLPLSALLDISSGTPMPMIYKNGTSPTFGWFGKESVHRDRKAGEALSRYVEIANQLIVIGPIEMRGGVPCASSASTFAPRMVDERMRQMISCYMQIAIVGCRGLDKVVVKDLLLRNDICSAYCGTTFPLHVMVACICAQAFLLSALVRKDTFSLTRSQLEEVAASWSCELLSNSYTRGEISALDLASCISRASGVLLAALIHPGVEWTPMHGREKEFLRVAFATRAVETFVRWSLRLDKYITVPLHCEDGTVESAKESLRRELVKKSVATPPTTDAVNRGARTMDLSRPFHAARRVGGSGKAHRF